MRLADCSTPYFKCEILKKRQSEWEEKEMEKKTSDIIEDRKVKSNKSLLQKGRGQQIHRYFTIKDIHSESEDMQKGELTSL